jgi:hypothetical protein
MRMIEGAVSNRPKGGRPMDLVVEVLDAVEILPT